MKSVITSLKAKWDAKYPVLRFILLFAIWMGLFYICAVLPVFKEELVPAYLRFNAEICGIILGWLGQEDVKVAGTAVFSSLFSIDIRRGCDAIDASALLICAILAFHSPFLLKIPGVVFGTLVLLVLNLARIVGLFFTGIHYPQAFEIMHIEAGQIAFILFAMLFFVLWLIWQGQRIRQDVSA